MWRARRVIDHLSSQIAKTFRDLNLLFRGMAAQLVAVITHHMT
jgi:hypothetical protein